MPQIGMVIRDVYRRPAAEAVPAHLERRCGIEVTETARLDAGIFRVDRCDGPAWVARVFVTARPLADLDGRVPEQHKATYQMLRELAMASSMR